MNNYTVDIKHTSFTRIAILAFTAFIVWVFKEPYYLSLLGLLLLTRKKETKRDISDNFDLIHDRLDSITRRIDAPE